MADIESGALFSESGRTGLNRYGGFIYEEYHKDLKGTKGVKVYKEMRDNEPVVGAILYAIKMLIRQASWRVEPAGNTSQDHEAADFLESCLYDMSTSWHNIITEILSMLVFGWSWHEIVFKRRMGDSRDPSKKSKYNDGRIGWRKLPIRAQESLYEWMYDEKDESLIGMRQQAPPTWKIYDIPLSKSLLFRTESFKDDPGGRSILRTAYRPYYFKKHIEEIEAIGIERDLAGLPVANVPVELLSKNATPEQKALRESIKKMLATIRRDTNEGIVFPAEDTPDGKKTGYKLSLLTSGGRRQLDTNATIMRYDRAIAITTLADFILIGHEKVGSFALNSSKTALFSTAGGAFLDGICEVFNSHAIPTLFSLNPFQGLTGLPELKHGDLETVDLTELGEYITAMSGAGATLFPDDALENYLRQQAGFPEKPEGAPDGEPGTKPKPAEKNPKEAAEELAKFAEEVRKQIEAIDRGND